jgi:7,8-dihydropterin-6-yl-methyl-4-(beta-D-ribofuranosyl)aminobenzene 5'-phosphate synthase
MTVGELATLNSETRGERSDRMQRRSLLRLGAVGTGLFLVGGAARIGFARAQSPRVSIPTVDRLVLTSTIDGSYDAVLPGGRVGDITVQRTTGAQPPLVAEHGLGLYLESFVGDERRTALLDFGNTYHNLSNNYQALGIDTGAVDALILSHGHADHFGGFLSAADANPEWADRGLTLYAAPDGTRAGGAQLDETSVQARGISIAVAKDPTVIADHVLLSGQIARTTDFETVVVDGLPVSATLPVARVEVGAAGSFCGDASHFQPTVTESAEGDILPDDFQGEIATVYNVRDRGLVIVSSCGHSGIVNTIRHVQSVTGIEKVHAVVGGIHLAAAPDAVVARTADAFQQIQPDYFVPMHCTGFYPAVMIEHVMPKRVVEPSSGTHVIFGA